METFEKKIEKRFEALEKLMEFFAKDMNMFTNHVNDLAVELHDDIGNLTLCRIWFFGGLLWDAGL